MASSRNGCGHEDGTRPTQRTPPRNWDNIARSSDATQRLRNEESWVEISSQPSSSSLSSIDNEIVTAGLRVQSSNLRRGRRHGPAGVSRISQIVAQRSTSSQDEYDESESSSDDRVLTSSNENITSGRVSPRQQMRQDIHFPPQSEDEDEEDEDGTALGITAPAFSPQPNAFSHPPNQSQPSNRGSYIPPRHYRSSHPTHQAANDAALRASLTTLLSCAKAARSLPKQPSPTMQTPGINRNEFQGLRLVPESELLGTPPAPTSPNLAPGLGNGSPSRRSRSSATVSEDENERGRRKTAQQGRSTKKKRVAVERAREQTQQLLSPTLVTWLVSAGVVIVVSAVGFGAGYALGYETGKQEGEILRGCGSEISVPRVKRFRWGGGSGIAA
ncbi:hypothetical protein V498_04510 [Pseudogymnoascus sp. VKM F-4517 (FW-2822)]|nr:hypothetical protein V498_04510 [Pseudogymnoascus sp. VKM F-4517 (FW-2822)]